MVQEGQISIMLIVGSNSSQEIFYPVCIRFTVQIGKSGLSMHRYSIVVLVILAFWPAFAAAQDKFSCQAMDRPCLMQQMETLAPLIDNADWRDQTFRELAKTYTYEGRSDKALALLPKIQKPDTLAMTIRGIGMAAASQKLPKNQYDFLFGKLKEAASKITHAPSQGIAYTYISMSQAFAGDDTGARATAAAMDNAALRNKAYGEAAEIQAERGDLQNALLSLAAINTPSYQNKAYDTVSRLFLEKAMVSEAYECAQKIDNPYLKAKSIQRILNKGNAAEENMEPKEDMLKDIQ
jgi:hypothetical protein